MVLYTNVCYWFSVVTFPPPPLPSQLAVSADLTLEVANYNEKLAVWEPLVEPIQAEDGRYLPWELNLQVVMLYTGNQSTYS